MSSADEKPIVKPPASHELDLGNDTVVTVTVGDPKDETIFFVHRKLICDASDVFTAALKAEGHFKENLEGTISLSTQDPSIVRLFIHWLYTGALPRTPNDKEISFADTLALIKLHIFADEYLIPSLRSHTISQLLDTMYGKLSSAAAVHAYKFTRPNCALRKLVSDYFALIDFTWLRANASAELAGCPELILDIMLVLTEHGQKQSNYFSPPFRTSRKARDAYLLQLEMRDLGLPSAP